MMNPDPMKRAPMKAAILGGFRSQKNPQIGADTPVKRRTNFEF